MPHVLCGLVGVKSLEAAGQVLCRLPAADQARCAVRLDEHLGRQVALVIGGGHAETIGAGVQHPEHVAFAQGGEQPVPGQDVAAFADIADHRLGDGFAAVLPVAPVGFEIVEGIIHDRPHEHIEADVRTDIARTRVFLDRGDANNEGEDQICRRIGQLEYEGRLGGEGKAKVIFVPCYLDGGDGIVNIGYYDLLPALDLTVFASYYEPWGYTPLESVAFGVPTITTDKAGFGQWVLETLSSSIVNTGVEVVERNDRDYSLTVEKIASIAASYARATEKEVSKARNSATATSLKADWRFFLTHYDDAFRIALRSAAERK